MNPRADPSTAGGTDASTCPWLSGICPCSSCDSDVAVPLPPPSAEQGVVRDNVFNMADVSNENGERLPHEPDDPTPDPLTGSALLGSNWPPVLQKALT